MVYFITGTIFFSLQTANTTLAEDINSYPLFGYSIAILTLWILNYFLIWMLYEYSPPINRLKVSRWIHYRIFRQKFFNVIFDESNKLWLPFITQYLDSLDDLKKINGRVGQTLQSSLLEFAVENGHLSLAKVQLWQNECIDP